MTSSMTFGGWLKRRRRQLDLTQKELARRVSCSEGTIRKIEGNRRRPSTQLAQLLATHLEIPLSNQTAFVTFARTKAYTADMYEALAAMGQVPSELPMLFQPTAIKHNLPPQPTPFIGRSQELVALNDLLTQSTTRLITIVGPGGIGKTRLALACGMQQITRGLYFSDGVFFINLAPLRKSEQMVSALADALKLPLQGDGRSPQQQLLDYLGSKEMLLIIDNFEHILDGTDLVMAIWQTAPKTRILVTSRERLHLQAEQVFQIEGLDFPEWESVADIESYTAIQLFLQSAHRNQFNFAVQNNDDLKSLARICHLLVGMPLAIELAASWIDRLSLADIAAKLQQGINFLETDMHDLPDRHRSLRAAFAHSWQRLEKVEQDVFIQLSVFRDGFTNQAAQEVSDANLTILSQLVLKSFLKYGHAHERYEIHELMRQFGAEMLAQNGELEIAAHDRHSDFYCHTLQQWELDLKSSRQSVVKTEIDVDFRNIESAWNYALAQNKPAQLLAAVNGLGEFYKLSGRLLEGMRAFQNTVGKLQTSLEHKFSVTSTRLLIWLLAWQVHLRLNTFRPLPSITNYQSSLQDGLVLLEQLVSMDIDTRKEEAFLRLQLGALLLQNVPVNWQRAEENLAISLQLHQFLNDLIGTADTLYWYHIYARGQGLLTQAHDYIQDNLALLRSKGDPLRLVDSLLRAGVMSRVFLAFDEAINYFDQAYLIAQAAKSLFGMWQALSVAAYHAQFRGHFDLALRYLYEVLSLATEDNNTLMVASAMRDIGWTQLYRGQSLQTLAQLEKELTLLPYLEETGRPTLQLLAHLHAGHYGLIQPLDEANEDPDYLLGRGWLALTKANHTEALSLTTRACHHGNILNPRELLAQSQSLSGVALLGLGQTDEAKQELFQGLQICLELGCFRPLMGLIPGICLVLISEADLYLKERGVTLYTLAMNLPYISNSQLFSDLIGRSIRIVAASLSLPIVTTPPVKEQEIDWWETAENLLQELTEYGWDKEK